MSEHIMTGRADWPEELMTAAVLYRRTEQARYRADGFEERMRQRLAADPGLNREVRAAWAGVERDILDRFRSMIPKTKADRDKGPKVFEVHHEIAVGKECFLLWLDETGSAAEAAAFTRGRLALTGDPAEFYAKAGLLEQETGPEPV
ncbi:hypothetical protein [Gemmobacter caeni]|nr:hypothetical protein [Gemmobacter caeni]